MSKALLLLCFASNVLAQNPPEEYSYLAEPSSLKLIRTYSLYEERPRSFLMCPKGYLISSIESKLDGFEGSPIYKNTTFTQNFENREDVKSFPVYKETEFPIEASPGKLYEVTFPICPQLSACLHYQACVFIFSTEFCRNDPNPGFRTNLQVNVTCSLDEVVSMASNDAKRADIGNKKDKTLEIKYKSAIGTEGINVTMTKLELIEHDEDLVFGASCPTDPVRQGYQGECKVDNHNQEMLEKIADRTWMARSRVRSSECLEELNQVYCSFAFNINGLCHPPFVTYPKGKPYYYNQR